MGIFSLSLASAYAQLTSFANLSNFWSLFDTAFGSSYDFVTATSFRSQWQTGDFSLFPQIEIVSGDVLGSANGAYAISTNRIYLSDQFVSSASQQSLEAVILEEFGHFVDAQVNQTDTAGDEGEVFSGVVRGVSLSEAELSRIKAEDDHGIMSLGDQLITIERAAPTILTVTTTADQNDGVTTDSLSLREAILIANANPNTDYEIRLTGGLTYNLTANGINEDAGKTGDLDITSRNNVLNIVSLGTQQAIINASNLLNRDRVVDVLNGGKLSLQKVVVTGGLSGDGGGVQVNFTGFLDLYNTAIRNNKADRYLSASSFGGSGAGISNRGSLYLRNSIISNNSTYGTVFGNGVYNFGTMIAVNAIINNNTGGDGGGIYSSGSLTVVNTTVAGNIAEDGGGIYGSGSATLINTTISGNSSSSTGGGIYIGSGTMNFVNSTVTNNIADDLDSFSSKDRGGGIYAYGGTTVNLKNTIIAGNVAFGNEGNDFAGSGVFNANNYNLIGDPSIYDFFGFIGTVGSGTDIIDPNPGLGPLQYNGGLTETHALLPGSPAIDAGNNNLIPVDSEDIDGDGDTTEPIPYDQRGLLRVVGTRIDIGAVERQITIASSNNDNFTNRSILLLSNNSVIAVGNNANATGEVGEPNHADISTPLNSLWWSWTAGGNGNVTISTNGSDFDTTLAVYTGTSVGSLTAIISNDDVNEGIERSSAVAFSVTNGITYQIAVDGYNEATGNINLTLNFTPNFPTISLAVSPANITEDGTPNLIYTFTRTGATTNGLTVNYSIAGTADATDYTGATPGTGKTITFAAGSATATLTIDPTADATIEANETVVLTLATGTGYTIGTATAATGTITNDDFPSITLAVAPASVLENGTTNLVYTFTRTGPTTSALTVNYGITGTADATDYTGATPGTGKTITFAAGSATATLTIDPTADTTIEANETVALTLATGTGYTIGTATAVTGTITNDDVAILPSITLAIAPVSVLEDGTPNLIYTFTRTGVTTSALTVNYSIAGTATATDYTGATPGTGKTITFLAGSATATLTIDPTADTAIETNETVALTLATGTSYTVGTTTAVTGTITNDDPTITLGLNYSGISEDSPSNFIYTFTRTGATTNSLTVNYSIAGTALSTDYTGATPGTNKTITFAAGSATATLTLDPTADTTLEPNETVILQLVSGTGYTIGTTAAQTATIINDDNTRNQQGTNGNSVLLGKNYSDYLTGGTGNDILNGAGNGDYLTGAAGNDTLTGGSGSDTFFFANANLGTDTITDFTPNEDTIFVSAQGFGSGLIAGNPLTQTQFILGSSATSASQRFIYNSTNGALSFDADGNGLGTAKPIATLNTGLGLTFEDIFVN